MSLQQKRKVEQMQEALGVSAGNESLLYSILNKNQWYVSISNHLLNTYLYRDVNTAVDYYFSYGCESQLAVKSSSISQQKA